MDTITFNKPLVTGKEIEFIERAVSGGSLSGDGSATQQIHKTATRKLGYTHFWLTPSCTQALEMAAILTQAGSGDEIIIPSYTFVSTANAFVMRGATPVFADSSPDHPNVDADHIESLITPKTKAIVVVHYAAMSCDMNRITSIANQHNLYVIEDAAQCIGAHFNGELLGNIGDFGALSFHETKNIHCGEGGALIVQDPEHARRAEIVREKGTNRSAFLRGEVDKYNWVDIGSSYLPSELNAAFLEPQLQAVQQVTEKRLSLWNLYNKQLEGIEHYGIQRPMVPHGCEHNGHIYYLICNSPDQRSQLIGELKKQNIQASFHYQALHNSPYFRAHHNGKPLPQAERYTDCLVRLPLHYYLSEQDVTRVTNTIFEILN